MIDPLKKFAEEHREAFDLYDPSPALWGRVEQQLQQVGAKRTPPVRVWLMRAAAAAAIVTGVWLTVTAITKRDNKKDHNGELAGQTPTATPRATETVQPETKSPATKPAAGITSVTTAPGKQPAVRPGKQAAPLAIAPKTTGAMQAGNSRSVYVQQYLKNNLPQLHEQFNEDMATLRRQYALLEQELKKNVNSERILSAMQQNLELQNELVNRQLNVIKAFKKIKHPNHEYLKRKTT